jgi:hypothetical protein
VLLYGSKTWKVIKTTTTKLQTFVNRCLRKILNIHWPEVISNEEFWRRTGETEMSIQLKRRKWNWIGHTLRKGNETIEREALDWNLQGKGREGDLNRRGTDRSTMRQQKKGSAGVKSRGWSEIGPHGDILLMPYVP